VETRAVMEYAYFPDFACLIGSDAYLMQHTNSLYKS